MHSHGHNQEHHHEHDHGHNHDPTHSHHHRSAWRNIALAAVELPLAAATGSFALTIAGLHNLADGKVHKLRDQSSHEKNHKTRTFLRLKAAGLLGAVGAGSYFIEKYTGVQPDVPAWVGGVLAAETVVNGASVVDSYRNSGTGREQITAILHNGTDAAISAATSATILLPSALGNENTTMLDTIAGYGHLGLIGTIVTYTVVTATKD